MNHRSNYWAAHSRHLPTLLLLPLLAFSCSPGGGSSADDPGPDPKKSQKSGALGEINIINKSQHAGLGIAEVVVPLVKGDFTSAPNVRTAFDKACQVFAMGAPHDDGSLRYLRLEVPVDSIAYQEQTLKLNYTDLDNPTFHQHPAVSGVIGITAKFLASGDTVTFPEPTLVEEGTLSKTFRSRLRVPNSMLWAELLVTLYSDLANAKFTLQWGNSDARTTTLSEDPGTVELQIAGAQVEFEYQAAKILSRRDVNGTTHAVLHTTGMIADGQSQLIEGRLVFADAAPPRLYALSKDWLKTGTFGPFGDLIPDIRVDPSDFENLVQANENKHKDHPWSWPVHGCNPSPSSTGSQNDFGSCKMRADVLLANPARLRTITRSVYQEACRTSHHRELDVSRVLAKNHPRLLTLTGRPKYEGKDPDMLGKIPNRWITEMMRSPEGQRWKSHDGQHLSINYLGGIALLTGNRFARTEIEHHCMLYLTGFTYGSGSYNDSPGASRQVGRSSMAAIWMYLVSGRDEIKQRVINRAKDLKQRMSSQNLKLAVIKPRSSGTKWYPWEEGNGTSGLAAIYRQFGTQEALDVVNDITRSLVMSGYGKMADGSWRIGYQLPIEDGSGNAYIARNDADFPNKAAGNGLTTWGIAGVMVAAELHPDAAVRSQAMQILQDRHSGATNGLDEVLDWVCVSNTAAALAKMSSQY